MLLLAKRTRTAYLFLAAVWVLFCLWQLFDHNRIKQVARAALLSRARDISYSVSVVIRSLGHFGVIPQTRLEAALQGLVKSQELQSVALLNASGQVVGSAGEPMELAIESLPKTGERWGAKTVTIVNLVDLGTDAQDEATTRPAPIIMRRPEFRPPPADDMTTSVTSRAGRERTERDFRSRRPDDMTTSATSRANRERPERDFRREFRRPRPFGRPPWMSEERYRELLETQGLHGFVLQMSIEAYRSEIARDFWLRITLMGIALLAATGLALAWRNVERSQRLQLRLLKASEMNVHLKELNIAAAGLAHETRNPLNIVRGQAQIISKNPSASAETRDKAKDIILEVDRITSRLTEFINYSKPPAPRPSPTNLLTVVREVERTLASDIEDKSIQFEINGADMTVEADESLLRQVLFNLLLNALQAVDNGGMVKVILRSTSPREACIEVHDNGPGVPLEAREDIFRPYFTTRKEGTGFGLAVVRQVVLAHQWEIEYIPGVEKGSIFRISGLKIM